jgi:hypothetical protein
MIDRSSPPANQATADLRLELENIARLPCVAGWNREREDDSQCLLALAVEVISGADIDDPYLADGAIRRKQR